MAGAQVSFMGDAHGVLGFSKTKGARRRPLLFNDGLLRRRLEVAC
jgi:hypothetical protein